MILLVIPKLGLLHKQTECICLWITWIIYADVLAAGNLHRYYLVIKSCLKVQEGKEIEVTCEYEYVGLLSADIRHWSKYFLNISSCCWFCYCFDQLKMVIILVPAVLVFGVSLMLAVVYCWIRNRKLVTIDHFIQLRLIPCDQKRV